MKFGKIEKKEVLEYLEKQEFYQYLGFNSATVSELYKITKRIEDMTRDTVYKNLLSMEKQGLVLINKENNPHRIRITKKGQTMIKQLHEQIRILYSDIEIKLDKFKNMGGVL